MIGLDHLAFLLAAGMLAATLPRSQALRAVAGFLVAGMAGLALHMAGLAMIQGALMLGAMALAREATRARWLRPAMGAAASFAGLGFLVVALVG